MGKSGLGAQRRERLKALREAALHRPVLARHLSDGFNGRWSRRQWAQASLMATMVMLVAAIVPGFSPTQSTPAPTPRLSMALPLPSLPLARRHGQAGDSWQLVRVERGQTLASLFKQLGLSPNTLHRVMQQPGARESLTRLRPGTELAFDMPVGEGGTGGELRGLRFDRDTNHRVEMSLDGDRIQQKLIERPTDTRTVVLSGKVGRSLFRSARKVGLTAANINTLTDDIFKYDIDFNDDVAASDRFSVVVEQTWREGELISTGPVLAATFTTGKTLHTGFRFLREGKAEYFTGDGRPLKKSFIRMPIPYARLTSGFGARRHPVLGRMRMHKGVDYAAGTGTPIMAAGDARVVSAGWQGGYGNAVVLDHGRGYTTLYGHMSRIGKIKRGQRIAQGTVIGYVGSTGMSTGPHLHYEFRINGVHRNPLSITMPPPEPLRGPALAQFRQQTAVALTRIQKVENIIYADAGPAPKQVASIAAAKKNGRKG
ncbi:peptidoglycan DD-metalloendopeptidase family protein [Lysobacter terrestris]|uniref:Peptidoglycan DD-metalloendopeptidase family protein n=2 Tax=Agrilutibacter terrestris TaxID=2865112 RepID=A0A7H0G0M0_9GAMM|nr:peptidoglycan DD-metalloendopeptidase family protein [Lysobacter terrestris]QNP41836.1 peptidoglycan DD-metalloendopeptidase family protein [Lysobacter terrestris]